MIVINSDYETSGMFDKDEQGWCSYRITVSCSNGKDVSIRNYYDANGIIRSDFTRCGTIEKKENNLVYIKLVNDTTLVFDLEQQKIVE